MASVVISRSSHAASAYRRANPDGKSHEPFPRVPASRWPPPHSVAVLAACPASAADAPTAHTLSAAPTIGVAHDTPNAYADRRATRAVTTNAAVDAARGAANDSVARRVRSSMGPASVPSVSATLEKTLVASVSREPRRSPHGRPMPRVDGEWSNAMVVPLGAVRHDFEGSET